jgi:energy-coupling factor transporter transmembrane protein EcfT
MFFFLLAAVVLTRSLFHMAWLLFFTVAVLFSKRQYFRRLATPAAVSLALVFFWYAKNMYVFGEFSSSSFFGMSFSKMTTFMIPEEERRQLVQEGKLSELSLIPPFSGIEAYEKVLPKTKRTGIPAVDLKQKTGMIKDWNRNYSGYVYVSRQYMRDALYSLSYRPAIYLVSILKSYDIFFRPASNYVFLARNRQKIEPISRFYNLVFLGQILDTSRESLPSKDHSSGYYAKAFFRMGLFLVIAFCGLLVFGFGLLRKALSQQPVDVPFTLTVMFIWTNVLYVATVGNCFEMGENFRFRFMIDPFLIVLLGLFLHSLRKRFIKNAAGESACVG